MRVLPNGLNELMENFKNILKDQNKNVIRMLLGLLSKFGDALGPACKQFFKKIIPGVINLLSDKQTLVRNQAVQCLDKWAEAS